MFVYMDIFSKDFAIFPSVLKFFSNNSIKSLLGFA